MRDILVEVARMPDNPLTRHVVEEINYTFVFFIQRHRNVSAIRNVKLSKYTVLPTQVRAEKRKQESIRISPWKAKDATAPELFVCEKV